VSSDQTTTSGTDAEGTSQDSPFRHERTARDEAPQYVLPLVVRIERNEPPGRTDALETAARAVLVMLSDERSLGDGEWAQAMRDWQDARIRKVVRRARGAEWRRAEALPGITVTGKSAEVRVFPPVPLDGWPKDLARLQVSGTDLDDPEPPGDADPAAPVLWLNPDLEMSAGKSMAQAGHGPNWPGGSCRTRTARPGARRASPSRSARPPPPAGPNSPRADCRWCATRASRRSRRGRRSPSRGTSVSAR
jgi:hypothetical protein